MNTYKYNACPAHIRTGFALVLYLILTSASKSSVSGELVPSELDQGWNSFAMARFSPKEMLVFADLQNFSTWMIPAKKLKETLFSHVCFVEHFFHHTFILKHNNSTPLKIHDLHACSMNFE